MVHRSEVTIVRNLDFLGDRHYKSNMVKTISLSFMRAGLVNKVVYPIFGIMIWFRYYKQYADK